MGRRGMFSLCNFGSLYSRGVVASNFVSPYSRGVVANAVVFAQ